MDYVPARQRSRAERTRLGVQQAESNSPYTVEIRASDTHSNLVLHNAETGEATLVSFWAGEDAEMQILRTIVGGGALATGGAAAVLMTGTLIKNLFVANGAGLLMIAGLSGIALKIAATPYDSEWREPHIDQRYAAVKIPLSHDQYETMRRDAEWLKENPPAYNPLDSASVWRNMPVPNADKLGGENCLGIVERLFDGIGMPLYKKIGVSPTARNMFIPALLAGHLKSLADSGRPTRDGITFYRFGPDGKPVISQNSSPSV